MTTYSIDVPEGFSELQSAEAAALLAALDAHLNPLWAIRLRLETLANAERLAAEVASRVVRARDGAQPTPGSPLTAWPAYRGLGNAVYPKDWVVRVGHRLFRTTQEGVSKPPAAGGPEWVDVTAELLPLPPRTLRTT